MVLFGREPQILQFKTPWQLVDQKLLPSVMQRSQFQINGTKDANRNGVKIQQKKMNLRQNSDSIRALCRNKLRGQK